MLNNNLSNPAANSTYHILTDKCLLISIQNNYDQTAMIAAKMELNKNLFPSVCFFVNSGKTNETFPPETFLSRDNQNVLPF